MALKRTMKNYFHLPVSHRKRKTRIALIIRLSFVAFLFGVYIFLTFVTNNVQKNQLNPLKEGKKNSAFLEKDVKQKFEL